VGPPVTLQGLLGTLEPGPGYAPGEAECPEGRWEIQVADHLSVQEVPVRDTGPEGTEVEEMHAVMR